MAYVIKHVDTETYLSDIAIEETPIQNDALRFADLKDAKRILNGLLSSEEYTILEA